MTSTVEAKKAALVRKAEVLADEMLDPAEQTAAERAIAAFYEHVPPVDVAERSPRNLCGAALSLWRYAQRRRRNVPPVRAYFEPGSVSHKLL